MSTLFHPPGKSLKKTPSQLRSSKRGPRTPIRVLVGVVVTRVAEDGLDVVLGGVEERTNLQVKTRRRLERSPGTSVCARTAMGGTFVSSFRLVPVTMRLMGSAGKVPACVCTCVLLLKVQTSCRCVNQMSMLIWIALIVSTEFITDWVF